MAYLSWQTSQMFGITNMAVTKNFHNLMNDLPVIGYPCLRKELWDRQGANIASRWKECIAKSCFRVQQKKLSVEKDQRFFAVVLSQKNLGSVDKWKM